MPIFNDMEFVIKKTWYNKTTPQPDGITHITDTTKQYIAYQFGLAKNYFIEDKNEVIDEIISDLKALTEQLQQLKDKSQETGKDGIDEETKGFRR